MQAGAELVKAHCRQNAGDARRRGEVVGCLLCAACLCLCPQSRRGRGRHNGGEERGWLSVWRGHGSHLCVADLTRGAGTILRERNLVHRSINHWVGDRAQKGQFRCEIAADGTAFGHMDNDGRNNGAILEGCACLQTGRQRSQSAAAAWCCAWRCGAHREIARRSETLGSRCRRITGRTTGSTLPTLVDYPAGSSDGGKEGRKSNDAARGRAGPSRHASCHASCQERHSHAGHVSSESGTDMPLPGELPVTSSSPTTSAESKLAWPGLGLRPGRLSSRRLLGGYIAAAIRRRQRASYNIGTCGHRER